MPLNIRIPREDLANLAPKGLTKQALAYAPAFVGAGVWAFAKFPEQLGFAADVYGRAFGIVSALYEDWTHVEGYGDALDEAIGEIRNPPLKVLDLATGTGFVARRLARRFPDAEVFGIDVTAQMIAIAQHQAVADGVQVRFDSGDSADIPFPDDEFDLVTVQNSIVYPDEMMRVTKPGGRAVIVFSFAGPWVKVAWPALQKRFEEAGAEYIWGRRAGSGFYGVARKAK